MSDDAQIVPHPTFMANSAACAFTALGVVLLLLALLAECLKLVHVLLGLVNLGCAALLFWWLWKNRDALRRSKDSSTG